jgi:hypothetical protein
MPLSLLSALMRSPKRALDLEIANVVTLVENAIEASGQDFPFPVDFFSRLPDSNFADVPAELWRRLWDSYVHGRNQGAHRFVIEAVKKGELFWDKALAFLGQRETSAHLEEWAATFTAVVQVVDSEKKDRLHAVLRELTICELTFGHITSAGGVKMIQNAPGNKFGPNTFRDLELEDLFRRKSNSGEERVGTEAPPPPSQVQVRGWRELGLLLRLAPAIPETLELMMQALDVHERPLAPAFADILKRFSTSSVVNWLDLLLRGRQARQLLAMDILWILVRSCPTLWDYLAAVVRHCVNTPDIPDLVGSRAIRILREVFDSSLPPEILALFETPGPRSLRRQGERDAWRGVLAPSLSLRPQSRVKGDCRLPALTPPSSPGAAAGGQPLSRKLSITNSLSASSMRRLILAHPP